MKICYIADCRPSTHAPRWIAHFVGTGHEVHLISTYPTDVAAIGATSLHVVPVDFSARSRSLGSVSTARPSLKTLAIKKLTNGVLWRGLAQVRDHVAPLMIEWRKDEVREIVGRIAPDIVHAMRVPFEGMLAARALRSTRVPLLISTWGNDFTLRATRSSRLGRLTREAMRRADGVHPDCRRDLVLARQWGFPETKPAAVLPGNGGIQTETFHPGPPNEALRARLKIPSGAPVVINPRGIRPYIRSEEFFDAMGWVLERRPDVVFLCSAVQGNVKAKAWADERGIVRSVRLLPQVTHAEMADYFRLAQVMVSPSDHDGTPNTLLEAMACGAMPVVGDIEPIHEWLTDGENALIVDQRDPAAIGAAILRALGDETLRRSAAAVNWRMVQDRAAYDTSMARAEELYRAVIASVR